LELVFFVRPFFGVGGGFFHFGDIGPNGGEFAVQFGKLLLTFRNLVFREDGVYRAFWFAEGAINTFVGVNDEKVRAFIETVYGTYLHAVSVFAVNAGFPNNKRHGGLLWFVMGVKRAAILISFAL
jgi:hypothetical protein